METRLFDVDPLTGVRELFHYDHENDSFTIEQVHDVEQIIEANKYLTNAAEGGWKGEMHRVASIPLPLYWELKKKGLIGPHPEQQKAFRAWLNDRDNLLFRSKAGKV